MAGATGLARRCGRCGTAFLGRERRQAHAKSRPWGATSLVQICPGMSQGPVRIWPGVPQGQDGFVRVRHKATRSGLGCHKDKQFWLWGTQGHLPFGLGRHEANAELAKEPLGTAWPERVWPYGPQG